METNYSSEWIAHVRQRQASLGQSSEGATSTSSRGPSAKKNDFSRWIVTAFRRYEVTLDFKCKFGVTLTHGQERTEGLKISFPKYMALAMVRDLPAEWHIWVSLPKMEIET